MQRSHFKDALSTHLERSNLNHHGKRFGYEHSANEDQQQFLFNNDGYRTDGTAESQRTNVAHEYFGGMCVVPEKTETGTHHGSAENRQLAGLPDVRDIEIVGKPRISCDVGQCYECR